MPPPPACSPICSPASCHTYSLGCFFDFARVDGVGNDEKTRDGEQRYAAVFNGVLSERRIARVLGELLAAL